MTTSEKLKKERKNKRYSLKQLEILSEIPLRTLQGYESGKTKNISHKRLIKLAEIYEKDPNYFLLNDNPERLEYEFNSNLKTLLIINSTLIEQFELLDDKKKIQLLEYISKFIKKNNQ